MKTFLLFIGSILFIPPMGISQNGADSDATYQSLKGPYLGQTPPSIVAELFAPGIISTDEKEALYGIFNNGSFIVFDRTPEGFNDYENYPIYICQEINGSWTKPQLTVNLGKPWYLDYPNPDEGMEIFYTWWLPLDKDGKVTSIDIWKAKFIEDRWVEPEKLPYPINTDSFDAWPSISDDGVLYFFSNRKGGYGKADIYKSVPDDGKYATIENLGSQINSSGLEHDPIIFSDGIFLIFSADGREGFGEDDLFVTFQSENGSWKQPINMGENINSAASENRPYLTPDEKFLFFTSTRNGNLDIFWVSSEAIWRLFKDDKE